MLQSWKIRQGNYRLAYDRVQCHADLRFTSFFNHSSALFDPFPYIGSREVMHGIITICL